MVEPGRSRPGTRFMTSTTSHATLHDDLDGVPLAIPTAAMRFVIGLIGCARPGIVLLVTAIAIAGCGRKGGLEAPGLTDGLPGGVNGGARGSITATEAQLAASRGLEPRARLGNTVVAEPRQAPALRGPRGAAEANLRAADIRGANADAPEAGDAIPEGPTVGTPPQRRFVLDPLL